MVEGKMACIKYLTFFFNFLFWLSGLALIIIGAIIRGKFGDYFSYADHKIANAPVFIIVVGVIVFVIGFLGCCGAAKENYCMVTTFAVLLAIVFILEIVAGALGFAYRKKVKSVVSKAFDRSISNYSKEKGAEKFLNFVQKKIKCCGKEGPSDYNKYQGKDSCGTDKGIASCYDDGTCKGQMHKKGCQNGFDDFVKKHMVIIGGVCIGIAFIQILGIAFACMLMKAIKSEYEVV